MSEITILVGTPGAGKTLYTMSELKKEFDEEIELEGNLIKRQVYYYNIPGVTVDDWQQLEDPTTWHTLPRGSVIIIDEAHEVFQKMDHKAQIPEHIEAAATLRHRGHTLVLITQHPIDLNIFLRRRCTRFIYLKRPLTQGNWATAFVWPEYEDRYKDENFQRKADTFTFTYPVEVFDTYKSSQLHTKKKYIPKAAKKSLYIGVIVIMIIISAGFFLTQSVQNRIERTQPVELVGTNNQGGIVKTIETTLDNYFAKNQPRIEGLPHTAPVYDGLTEPKIIPKYNCISTEKRCQCYTQQATRIVTTDNMCRKIIEHGYFDPTRENDNA